ncbi:hypothetical protein [Streptomyces sp. NBC_00459]|uniref:hypothetical protein n=1 Tax=Streptomyces sp. NBC_00459 TaxID=2975749 RepID=UPI002E1872F8
MASVTLDTAALETLVEAVMTKTAYGMEALNVLRVANGKTAHPTNYGIGDLTRPHDSDFRAALAGVQGGLDA